eukprot:30872-Pelagococcus_subviridis.AAC.7
MVALSRRGNFFLHRVRLGFLILRRHEQLASAHRRRDREDRVETAEQRAEQEHLAHARVHGHVREVFSERRQRFRIVWMFFRVGRYRAVGRRRRGTVAAHVQRSQRHQLVQRRAHGVARRRRRRRAQRRLHPNPGRHRLDVQTQLLQRRAKHLRRLVIAHARELRAREEREASAGGDAPGAPASLLRRGSRHPRVREDAHPASRIVAEGRGSARSDKRRGGVERRQKRS